MIQLAKISGLDGESATVTGHLVCDNGGGSVRFEIEDPADNEKDAAAAQAEAEAEAIEAQAVKAREEAKRLAREAKA